MKKFPLVKQIAWFFFICFVFSGCANRVKLDQNAISKINKVGVYSGLGNTFQNNYIGFTIFENNYEKIDVSDWEIDNYLETLLTEKLNSEGHLKISGKVNWGPQRLVLTGRSHLFNSFGAEETEPLSKKALEQGFDHYILVIPQRVDQDYIPNFLGGYGFYAKFYLFGTRHCSFVNVSFRLMDSKTNERVTSSGGYPPGGGLFSDRMEHMCFEMPILWQEHYGVFDTAIRPVVETHVKNNFASRMNLALEYMGLVESKDPHKP